MMDFKPTPMSCDGLAQNARPCTCAGCDCGKALDPAPVTEPLTPADIVVLGDSYSAAIEGDTHLDHAGWAGMLNIPEINRQAISGTTASDWVNNKNGMLDKALATPCKVVIISLLGNDLMNAVKEHNNELKSTVMDFAQDVVGYTLLVNRLKASGKKVYLLAYTDPFSAQLNREAMVAATLLNMCVGKVAELTGACVLWSQLALNKPEHFTGDDIHPTHAGHQALATYTGAEVGLLPVP